MKAVILNNRTYKFVRFMQGEAKKTGINGILADFAIFFSLTIMAFNIIENVTIFGLSWILKRVKKKCCEVLEIGNSLENKKGANFELMAKS